jgi:hypothetical protein
MASEPRSATIADAVGLTTGMAMAVGSDGNPVFSFPDETQRALLVAISLTLDASGLPMIGYFDSIANDIKVARCSDANCSSSTKSVHDNANFAGIESSIAMAADGLARVVYRETGAVVYKFGKCGK